jgi:hypothetical protein
MTKPKPTSISEIIIIQYTLVWYIKLATTRQSDDNQSTRVYSARIRDDSILLEARDNLDLSHEDLRYNMLI